MNNEVVISCAVTGSGDTAKKHPNLPITISELYLIREVCQSYVKVNTEQVGYNLLRKLYRLILDSDLKERAAFENLIHEVDFNLDKNSLKIDKEESNG